MNSVNIIGNIGTDLELRTTQNGHSVTSFNLAVNNRDDTVWVPIVVWGATAENLCKFQGKGSKIGVTGRLTMNQWQDKEGRNRQQLEVTAFEIEWLDSKKEGVDKGNNPPAAEATDDFAEIEDSGDLPF